MSIIVCIIVGGCIGVLAGKLIFGARLQSTALPPSTVRRLARAARANRADLRHLRIVRGDNEPPAAALDDFETIHNAETRP